MKRNTHLKRGNDIGQVLKRLTANLDFDTTAKTVLEELRSVDARDEEWRIHSPPNEVMVKDAMESGEGITAQQRVASPSRQVCLHRCLRGPQPGICF